MTNVQIYLYVGVPFETLIIFVSGRLLMVATHNVASDGPLIPTNLRDFWHDYVDAWKNVRDIALRLLAAKRCLITVEKRLDKRTEA